MNVNTSNLGSGLVPGTEAWKRQQEKYAQIREDRRESKKRQRKRNQQKKWEEKQRQAKIERNDPRNGYESTGKKFDRYISKYCTENVTVIDVYGTWNDKFDHDSKRHMSLKQLCEEYPILIRRGYKTRIDPITKRGSEIEHYSGERKNSEGKTVWFFQQTPVAYSELRQELIDKNVVLNFDV